MSSYVYDIAITSANHLAKVGGNEYHRNMTVAAERVHIRQKKQVLQEQFVQ